MHSIDNELSLYRRSSVVCVSVCLSVTFVYLAKTAEPIEKTFGGADSGWPQEPCIRWGALTLWGRCKFLGVVRLCERHWETLLRCMQKRMNWPRCRFVGWLMWLKRNMYWMVIKVGQIHSPLRGVARWLCGVSSELFDHLLPMPTVVVGLVFLPLCVCVSVFSARFLKSRCN